MWNRSDNLEHGFLDLCESNGEEEIGRPQGREIYLIDTSTEGDNRVVVNNYLIP